ncbi:MAG: lipid-A-disaccharide synthase N-terminal domain-containing protein [Elusimicrobia bacterium]|nr:lipid-A-disaccharide synthase N-terminal domain-containing protein [Elusimicrobiota bacterium]
MTELGISHWGWLVVGTLAQLCFFSRFLVQWLASEARGESVVPTCFWHLSLLGSAGLLAYAWHAKDPVFIAGQSMGLLVYSRNLYLIARKNACPPPPRD